MLVETENLVTADSFRRDFDHFVDAAGKGRGPVAITRDSQVVGIFMSPEEYDALFGATIKRLLKTREKGPVITQAEVRAQAEQVLKRRRRS